MATQPKKSVKKAPAAKPQARPNADGGPPKHLAYITEEEAKLLDIILTIKKGATGKDGKPLPQTYSPGKGNPLEFLTELSSEQINELLAKTDGESETTPEGVESYAMEGSVTRSGGTVSRSGVTRSSSAPSRNSGTPRDQRTGASPGAKATQTRDSGNRDTGVAPGGGRERPGAFGGIDTGKVKTTPTRSTFKTETVKVAPRGVSPGTGNGTTPVAQDSVVRHLEMGKPAQVASTLAGLVDKEPRRPTNSSIPSGSELASLVKAPATVSGPGKTDRENVTTIEQNGIGFNGKRVGFTQGADLPSASSIPSGSELASLVKAPPKSNVTEINKNPNGPMPQRTTDVPSELSRLAVGSQFNTPLADDPGAYDESELASAVTGETPRAIGSTSFEDVARIRSDPTATQIANPDAAQIMSDQLRPAPMQNKVDREILSEAPRSAAGKTDRARAAIMGDAPILPFRNGVPDDQPAAPPSNRNSVPDSSLSPLATQKPPATDDLITSPSPAEREQFMPQQMAPAPSPIGIDGGTEAQALGEEELMPDISFDANQPETAPTLFDPQAPEPVLPAEDGSSGGPPVVDDGTAPLPGEEPGAGPSPVPGDGTAEYLPGIMPWDRMAFEEISRAYEAAGKTYTPEEFRAAFYNSQPFTIEHPAADDDALAPSEPGTDPYDGIMPWDRVAYNNLRKSYEAVGQTFTPEQFIMQYYATPQSQAA